MCWQKAQIELVAGFRANGKGRLEVERDIAAAHGSTREPGHLALSCDLDAAAAGNGDGGGRSVS